MSVVEITTEQELINIVNRRYYCLNVDPKDQKELDEFFHDYFKEPSDNFRISYNGSAWSFGWILTKKEIDFLMTIDDEQYNYIFVKLKHSYDAYHALIARKNPTYIVL